MRRDKLATAKKLAKDHCKVDPSVKQIFLLEPLNADDPKDPIKLLEVVDGTLARGVDPIGFAADPARGIDYSFWIVEVSPREYRGLGRRPVQFQDHVWTIGAQLAARP